MRKLILLCLLLISFGSINAQSISKYGYDAQQQLSGAKELRISSGFEIPTYIEFQTDFDLIESNWQTYYKQSFNLPTEYGFELISSQEDELGFKHDRYVQTYSNYPIELAHLLVHSKAGIVHSINGSVYKNRIVTPTSLISFESGLDICKKDMNATSYKWESEESENHLKIEQNDLNATYLPTGELVYIGKEGSFEPEDLRLCRKYNVYAFEPLIRTEYFVDAKTGEIIFREEEIHTTNKPGTAVTGYSGTQNIIADSIGDNLYRLRETLRGLGVATYDMNNNTQHAQAIDFIDSNNVWSNFNGQLDQYAGDAHWGAEVTYDYFANIHLRNSIDGNGFALNSYVHYGSMYNNAFWDGQRMTYGDGNGTNSPLTSIDIAGHEIAHGLTRFSANLIYRSESGALNESFSDIFGVTVENHGRPANWNWLMGEDIGSPFRNMSNPNAFGDPDTYNGLNWINQNCFPTNTNDWCGVHTNSGVQNYWFYLLSQGGSGVNDILDTFNVTGIGITPASKVAFRNLTVYLTRFSNYDDARFYSIKAAIDIYGGCSPEVIEVTNAWYAVGVGPAYTSSVISSFTSKYDSAFCKAPMLVEFNNYSTNVANLKWYFGDGDTSALVNPIHQYNNVGRYTVKLVIDGGACGSDSLERLNYINIDTNNYCSFSMNFTTSDTLYDCKGKVYDNGGLNGDYSLFSQDTVYIYPPNSDYVEFIFDSFDFNSGAGGFCNEDYLEIFDGATTESRSLGRFCSSNLPLDTINSTGPFMVLVVSSNGAINSSGFSARYECKQSLTSPIAGFEIEYDTTCNGNNQFFNRTQLGANSFLWNFGDGTTSTEENPNHYYQTNGIYTVSLTATNSAGSNTMTRPNSVNVNMPVGPTMVGDTNCINGRFKLAATGSGTLNWYETATNTNKVFVGDTFRLNGIMRDTSYFVSSFYVNPKVTGVPFLINGNGNHSTASAEIYFDVFKPTIIESFILNSNRSGYREILLKDNGGEIIDKRSIYVPGSPSQVSVNLEVPTGLNYSLSVGSANPDLYINTTGASYPYNFSNFMSITGSSLGAAGYPFFYFFIAKELPCQSERSIVNAIVDTTCIITSTQSIDKVNNKISIYPNPTNSIINIERPSKLRMSLLVTDLIGKEVIVMSNIIDDKFSIDMTELTSGVYLVKIQNGDTQSVSKIVKE
jgi:Zn-dependent metalloprotease/PKD repeat protein